MTETIERIINLMTKKNDTCHSLEVRAKLPISTVAGWKSGKCKPSMDSIIKLAIYFNMSADYLLCLSDDPTPLKVPDVERHSFALSLEFAALKKEKRFVEIAKMYNVLPAEYREMVYRIVQGIILGLGLKV